MVAGGGTGPDHAASAAALARWNALWSGRELFRAAAGPGWLRLHLAGDERPALLLLHRPGAALILAGRGPLPAPLRRELEPTLRHPLTGLLQGAVLERIALLPDDRVAHLAWNHPQRGRLALLHQLFGPRGNLALLDPEEKLLWAAQRPPHSLLCAWPPSTGAERTDAPAGSSGTAASAGLAGFAADDFSAAALDRWAAVQCTQRRTGLDSRLRRKWRAARRLVENLGRDLERAERGDEYRRIAETLAVHLHTLEQGMSTATLADPRDGQEITIELDPQRSPAANLESWFRRARKAEKGRDVIAERLQRAERDVAVLGRALETLDAAADGAGSPLERLEMLQSWQEEHSDLLTVPRRSRSAAGPEEPARPFRRYRIDGRWEVWIGRSNQENDALTFGASHGKDLWLHAQGVPGSHVILRTGGHPERVPRSVLERAAALAALHCRAKHSALVPVVWTERRYVRKPRKAPPGTARCLREKSLFVEPGVGPRVEAE